MLKIYLSIIFLVLALTINLDASSLIDKNLENNQLKFSALEVSQNTPASVIVTQNLPTSQYYFIADDLFWVVTNPIKFISDQNLYLWAVPAIMFAFDQPLYNFYSKDVEPVAKQWPIKFNDDFIFKSMQVVHLVNSALNNNDIRTVNYALGEAMVDAYFISQTVKHIFGRARPPTGLGPYSWFHFSLNPEGPFTSFFSTHATVYFSASTILGKYFKNEILGDLIGVLAFLSLEGHNHWVSDMVVGYLVGKCIGSYVWEKCSNRDLRDSWWIYPTFMPHEGQFYPAIGAWKFF
ncbi:MAG: phosphatase PAP2 family protein [Candidatus Margulisiibacteriota bacterium]|jgi:hypothetical protein